MKDFKELAAILNAAAEGKVIEEYDRVNNTWSEVTPSDLKYKNACNVGYLRVKPEPKYTPYKSAIDVALDVKNHGPLVKNNNDEFCSIVQIYTELDGSLKIFLENGTDDAIDASDALGRYDWQDGHPFGILLV